MNKINYNVTSNSPETDEITVAPYVGEDGIPKVILTIRTDIGSVHQAQLNGHPALYLVLGEETNGQHNGPWQLGHLLTQQWDEAKKLADAKKQGEPGVEPPAGA